MKSINTKLVEKIHIVTEMKDDEVKVAKDYLNAQDYTITGSGPIVENFKAYWEIQAEKDFHNIGRIAKSGRYMVVADHPVLTRVDKVVYSGELSMFIMTLESMDYENIKISKK